ncbi:hypothetical protein MICAK_2860003 [Microcystis aeruginosa PCC 9701]|uniref:Uncharacterized protein n=1 Tax=Microcystis aeruginosa PCC 9701 TaxID=721123 RepID=I4IRR0_MICAE|nr:hypothetical protein MICAK_2860003 [Microcystis aeruginosa PCC 9701]
MTDFGEEQIERVIQSVENRSEGSRADTLGCLTFSRYCLETSLQLLDVLGGDVPTGIPDLIYQLVSR